MKREAYCTTVTRSLKVHFSDQHLFHKNNDTAKAEEDAVFPTAVGFARLVPAVFKMHGTGTEGHGG